MIRFRIQYPILLSAPLLAIPPPSASTDRGWVEHHGRDSPNRDHLGQSDMGESARFNRKGHPPLLLSVVSDEPRRTGENQDEMILVVSATETLYYRRVKPCPHRF